MSHPRVLWCASDDGAEAEAEARSTRPIGGRISAEQEAELTELLRGGGTLRETDALEEAAAAEPVDAAWIAAASEATEGTEAGGSRTGPSLTASVASSSFQMTPTPGSTPMASSAAGAVSAEPPAKASRKWEPHSKAAVFSGLCFCLFLCAAPSSHTTHSNHCLCQGEPKTTLSSRKSNFRTKGAHWPADGLRSVILGPRLFFCLKQHRNDTGAMVLRLRKQGSFGSLYALVYYRICHPFGPQL